MLLAKLLSGGERDSEEVKRVLVERYRFSKWAVRAGRKKLGVRTRWVGRTTYWSLGEEDARER